jgi:hypothetical protein
MAQIVPVVTAPVITLEDAPPLTLAKLAGLAREIAMEIREVPDILQTYKISAATYEKLKDHEVFTRLIDSARVEWHAAINTPGRTQIEAAAALEQAIPVAYARAISGNEAMNHVTDFLKLLADIGGVRKDPSKGTPGERFQININLGSDTISLEGSKMPISGEPTLTALPMPEIDKEERV